MHVRIFGITAIALLSLSACKVEKTPTSDAAQVTEPASAPLAASAATNSDGFSIESVPVSTATLGAFPYFTLPAGYEPIEKNKSVEPLKSHARFPFWVKGKEHMIEGQMYQSGFTAATGKSLSLFEVASNFDSAVKQLGGVKVSEEMVPSAIRRAWPNDVKNEFYYPYLGMISNPAHVWLIRRNDGNIWVALSGNERKAGYVIAKEGVLNATTQLLPAAALKQAIDTAGKVDLQVNFATDKTEILPTSLPQIDQVVQLLKDDSALKLAVNGHTDSTGAKGHNLTLSDGRAKSVVAMLVAQGIDAARLQAKGYGDTKPVADNGTEEGKAKNRRVELVKM